MSVRKLDQQTIRKIRSEQVIIDVICAVKELIENSLDAKAHHIWIKMWGKGLTKIVVRDDGVGIRPSDLALCGQRHCTSKLGRVTHTKETIDLPTAMASSYGFRGEALAALIELSRVVEITSRTQEEERGWSIKYQTDERFTALSAPHTPPSPQIAACEVGTTVVVEGLFATQPVRLNILKKESGQFHRRMRQLLDNYALARPEVRLHCEYVHKQLTPPSPSKSPFTKQPIAVLSSPLTSPSNSVEQRRRLLQSNLTLVLVMCTV
jgi:DNA mismatch repair protein MutL